MHRLVFKAVLRHQNTEINRHLNKNKYINNNNDNKLNNPTTWNNLHIYINKYTQIRYLQQSQTTHTTSVV